MSGKGAGEEVISCDPYFPANASTHGIVIGSVIKLCG